MKNTRSGGIGTRNREGGSGHVACNWGAWKAMLALAIFVMYAPPQARGDERYVSKEYGFSLNYAEDIYEEQPIESGAGVVFILRNRSGGFPTFTVSTGEGGYQPDSDAEHANKVLNEYRRVGFDDAQVVKVSRYVQRGVPLQAPLVVVVFSSRGPACERRSGGRVKRWGGSPHVARFDYFADPAISLKPSLRRVAGASDEDCDEAASGSEVLLRSKVLSVSTPSRHFTLTYMDYADRADRGESRRLFDNFFIGTVKEALSEEPVASRYGEGGSSWRVSTREVLGLFTPLLNGLMELTFGDLRPEEPSRSPRRERFSAPEDERRDSFAEVSRPLASDFLNSALPTSQGGQLFGLLALFVSGVMLKRLRRR